MSNKQPYAVFCDSNPDLPLFSSHWWLNAVSINADWDAAIVENNGAIVGTLPYVIKKRYGMRLITMPPLTQTLGPWLRRAERNSVEQESDDINTMKQLISQIPCFSYFCQNFHYSIANHLPFYWAGFEQRTRYTYVFNDLSDLDSLWKGLRSNIVREIKKARNRFGLQVDNNLPLDDFILLHEGTFRRQGLSLPYSRDVIYSIDRACSERQCRKIFCARDDKGAVHAALYIVWNANSAYYLMGGSDPDLRTSGANSLCMWEAIRFASGVARRFDFEGSMLEPVERFFRAFGAVRTPYFEITKTTSPLLRIIRTFRTF